MNNEKYKDYEVVENAFSQKITFKEKILCPVCNSDDIIIQKGEGQYINGLDFIAIICNKCRKKYGFYDVKYKPNCPDVFKKIN